MDCGFEMDLSDRYPVWSTGESNRKVNIAPMNDLNSNNLMNVSDVPAWDSSACDVWPQTAFSKGTGVCGDVESLMSSGNTLDLTEGTPAWASNPLSWDHDSATRLAEKLLPFQSELSAADQLGRDVGNKDMTMMNSQFSHGGYKFEQLVPTGGGSSNPRFKTEFCRNFREKGDCVYGAQCQFAHGKAELRHDVIRHSKYKTKLCQKYWINGWCAYGTRCNFIHQEESNSSGDKTRTLTNQTGFRPLLPGRNMRKSSESSADSGVDFGLFNPKVGGEKCLAFASNRFEADNEFYPSSDTGGVRHLNYSRISSFGMVDANLSNMNLATELNRNLYNYMDVKEKEKRSVPHPEDNPIPAPSAAVNSFNRNSEFRLLSGIPNSWAL